MGAVFFLILIDLPPGGAQSLPQAQAGRDGDRPRVLPLDPDQIAPRSGEIAKDEGRRAPAGLSFQDGLGRVLHGPEGDGDGNQIGRAHV